MTAPTSFNEALYFLTKTALQCILEVVRFSVRRQAHLIPPVYTITSTSGVIYVLHGAGIFLTVCAVDQGCW